MKTTYSLSEIKTHEDAYTDSDGNFAYNYNLPEGWSIGCVLEGEMTAGSVWTATKNAGDETLEQDITIIE